MTLKQFAIAFATLTLATACAFGASTEDPAGLIDHLLHTEVSQSGYPRDISSMICRFVTEAQLTNDPKVLKMGMTHSTDPWGGSVYQVLMQTGPFSSAALSITFDGKLCRASVQALYL